jgi:hypothetical protein
LPICSQKNPLLNNKIPALTIFRAIVPTHALVKCKVVFGNFAFCTAARVLREPSGNVPKPEGVFIVGAFFTQLDSLSSAIRLGVLKSYQLRHRQNLIATSIMNYKQFSL